MSTFNQLQCNRCKASSATFVDEPRPAGWLSLLPEESRSTIDFCPACSHHFWQFVQGRAVNSATGPINLIHPQTIADLESSADRCGVYPPVPANSSEP